MSACSDAYLLGEVNDRTSISDFTAHLGTLNIGAARYFARHICDSNITKRPENKSDIHDIDQKKAAEKGYVVADDEGLSSVAAHIEPEAHDADCQRRKQVPHDDGGIAPRIAHCEALRDKPGVINGETGTGQGVYIQVMVWETASIPVWRRQRKFNLELPRSPSRIIVDSSDSKYIADGSSIFLEVLERKCR